MERIFEILKKPAVYYSLLMTALAVMGGAVWAVYHTQIPPEQPIQFPHDIHVGLQIQCLYCHPGAWKQASAGLPTQDKCWACHEQLTKYRDPNNPQNLLPLEQWPPELQKLAGYVERNEPIRWVPVSIVPDHVQFNHRPHVAAGVACEVCHGDMSRVKIAENPQIMNMGWCITCHQQSSVEDPALREKLISCETCHY